MLISYIILGFTIFVFIYCNYSEKKY